MDNILGNTAVLYALRPVDCSGGPFTSRIISLKNCAKCLVNISVGVTTGTMVMTLNQCTAIAGTGAKTLAFTKYWMYAVKLKYDGASGPFTVGEVVNGAGGGQGTVYKDNGDYLLLYTVNATAFVDNETITGASSATTASANGIGIETDTLVPITCSSTFTIPAVSDRSYLIEVDPRGLDVANGFDCLRVQFADASAGCIAGADFILQGLRYAGDPNPSMTVD